jgi:hypothetical protein
VDEQRLIRIGELDQFDLITRCALHGEPRLAVEQPCATAMGVEIAGMPIFCELAAGHDDRRHVHENGGHACWELDHAGRCINGLVRDFRIQHPLAAGDLTNMWKTT